MPVASAPWQGLEPRQRRQHTLEALRHLILRESQIQPLLLILEDLHWIDAETQAWLDGLVDGLPAAHLLLLVTYRPEYQHAWGNRTYYTQLRVEAVRPVDRDQGRARLPHAQGHRSQAPVRGGRWYDEHGRGLPDAMSRLAAHRVAVL